MLKRRITALFLILIAVAIGFFVYSTEKPVQDSAAATSTPAAVSKYAFKLGLDLKGGTHLIYKADVSAVPGGQVGEAMTALRDVIERRVNLFGVSEPVVQVEESGVLGALGDERLIVELPGVTDVQRAVAMIGETPLLEFRLLKDVSGISEEELKTKTVDEVFQPTGLNGRYIKRAILGFDQTTGEPKVVLEFNAEGDKLFSKITRENVGQVLAIFLDGTPISMPVIKQEIIGGSAEISGNFKAPEAKKLVRDLNYGALPLPISLISTETIGASLGEAAVESGLKAGLAAFILVAVFLLLWYRLPGAAAVLALAFYVILNLAIFKLVPVTLTAAGIAGFILSLGMAVDANILIFERMKEEILRGRLLEDAMKEGFARAWLSIRDSNLSSIITASVLYAFASTNVIRGFALVFAIGVLSSMFTAITASRIILMAMRLKDGKISRFLFSCGLK